VQALAGSLYLISTAVFCFVCLAIGVRLLALAGRTGARPERLLGLGLGLTGGVGYGALIALALVRQAHPGVDHAAFTWAGALAKLAHDVGVLCVIAFVLTVFRPREAWARALAGAMALLLCAGYAGYGLGGHFAHGRPEGFWYWLEFSAIGTYQVWGAAEAFLYWARMRRRRAHGLGDPAVENRFLLWGLASLFAVAAIWTISWPALRGLPIGEQQQLAPGFMLVTAVWGIAAIGAYWLTFFPPRWYRARLAAAVAR
jgi:hypothetical protein